MKRNLFLVLAMSMSLASLGAYAQSDSSGSPSGSTGSSSSGSSGSSESGAAGGSSMGGAGTSFDSLDKNHDGKISKSEAKNDPSLEKNFKQYDTDSSGSLSRSEFDAAMGGGSPGTGGGSEAPSSSSPSGSSSSGGSSSMGGSSGSSSQ